MPVPPVTNTAALPSNMNKKNQQKGSGFTNINSILDANKGAGEKIGQTIGGKLSDQANSVRSGIQQSQSQFNQQKQQAGQQATNAVQAGQALNKQAGETDEAYQSRIAGGSQNYNQIGENLRNAQYNGPMELANGAQLQAQGSNVSALGRLAGNTQGQTQLLRSMVAKPGQYTRGQSALDQLLLGQTGQKAIQQGRQATLGLGEKAAGAEAQAEAQANALKSGISTNRANAISGIQNAVTGEGGIQTQAANQAKQFQKDASDLQAILSGTFDVSTPEGKQRAQDLVQNMNQFGLEDYNLYNKDSDLAKSAVGQLGSTLTQQFGDRKYNDAQKQAALNLATVLGDKGLQNEISGSNFNTDVFGNESDSFGQLDKNRIYDTETKGILQGVGNQFKTFEDQAKSAQQAQFQSDLAQVDLKKMQERVKQLEYIGADPSEIQKLQNSISAKQNEINNYKTTLDPIKSLLTNPESMYGKNSYYDPENYRGSDQNPYHYGQMYNATPGTGEFKGMDSLTYNTEYQPLRDYVGSLSDKGFLAFGDRGNNPTDLPERFQNLGLTAETGKASGMLRSSGQLLSAADKALGPDAKLKDFILNQILGLNAGGQPPQR